MKVEELIRLENEYGAHNYNPLDVVIARGRGVWVYDVEGKKYLDFLSAYSAVNQGHAHPRLIKAAKRQMKRITLTSRAFRNDQLPLLCRDLCQLTGFDRVLPMNSGAEAVETAIKAVRKWAYTVKGVPKDQAEIIVAAGNFHGRTTTIISFSTEEQYRFGFGPFTPGFVIVPFGDAEALARAVTPNTAAVLIEPVQGEGGINVPPEGYLREIEQICRKNNVLFIVDEIQTGLGRCGRLFAYQFEGVSPDGIIIGKGLAGGFYPISAFIARKEVMDVFTPGDHGSTFGGNPLACAIAREALKIIIDENLPERARELGDYFMAKLNTIDKKHIKEVRGQGLLIGVDLKPEAGGARRFCEALRREGLLCKETHETIIRFAPPLVIKKKELDWAFERVKKVLETL
ncbi:MAG: ornithine--oxo-acid transaminase [candidate division KSB1 bacterium]|nr:ornithine--oxo-acid transaminase [candidate division KSB1 bacterium]MDZ7346279.1 ornithine--oxo-acid transaminase [candidate division KSB1 bacterium]